MTLTTETLNLWRNNAEITAGETAEDDPEHIAAKAILALTAELLANREAQPVIVVGDDGGDALAYRRLIQSFAPGTKLYAAPPAPEITDEAIDRIVVPLSPDGLDEEKYHCEWHLYHDRERIRKELREYFTAPRSPEELEKYTQGVKDGLEWAARTVEANHPNTGDWLYDDRDDLAKAIRKGPDMLAAAPESVNGA